MPNKKFCINKIFQDKSWMTISNFLTFIRILLTPFIVVGIYLKLWTFVFWTLVFVGFSDLLDGYLARLLNEITYFGKLLDPLADKFLIISSFASLAFFESPSFPVPTWFVILILFREFVIIIGTYCMLRAGIDVEISPTILGKLTTLFQILFLLWLFICYFFEWVPAKTYYTVLILLAIFSILSLLKYINIGLEYVQKSYSLKNK